MTTFKYFNGLIPIVLILLAISASSKQLATSKPKQTHTGIELSNDELSLAEPAIVPEPTDGSRWWYTPSRRAHIHSQNAKNRLVRSFNKLGKANEELRLPGDVLPTTYAVRLLPFIEEGNFTTHGHVDIFIDCVRDTNNISINAADITIDLLSISVKTCNKHLGKNDN